MEMAIVLSAMCRYASGLKPLLRLRERRDGSATRFEAEGYDAASAVPLVAPALFQPDRLHRPVEVPQRGIATIDGFEANRNGPLRGQAIGQ